MKRFGKGFGKVRWLLRHHSRLAAEIKEAARGGMPSLERMLLSRIWLQLLLPQVPHLFF
jgi:hypothetical protein